MSQDLPPDDAKGSQRTGARSFIVSTLGFALIMFVITGGHTAFEYLQNQEGFAAQWRSPGGLARLEIEEALVSLLCGALCAWVSRQSWAEGFHRRGTDE